MNPSPRAAVSDMDRLRVLFVLTGFGTGGSERLVLELSRTFNQRKFEPMVLGFTDGSLREKFNLEGVRTILFRKKPGIDLSLMFKVSRLIKEERIDLVCTHHFMPLFYAFPGSRISRKVRLVHTEHAEWELEQLGRWRFIAKFLMNRADRTIGVSDRVARCLRDRFGISTEQVGVIHNGVDLTLFRNGSEKSVAKERLGIDPADYVIGSVGNFRSEKNHAFLVDAFRDFLKTIENSVLVLVGDGPLRSNLEQQAADLMRNKRVRLIGPRNDVDQVMQSFDAYCLPSLHEGLPMTLLEAMASGVPIVGTDVEGIRDFIQDGVTGVLCPLADPQQLASALHVALTNEPLRKMLIENGKGYVRDHHDLRTMTLRYENLFQEVAGR